MPGIVGLITPLPREQAESELLRMLDCLRHEAFYTTGTWIDEPLGVYVGWAVRKSPFSMSLPQWNEGRDVFLVFSGDDFPKSEAIRQLRHAGHNINNEPQSHLVHTYEHDTASFPRVLNGRFQGLIADRTRGTAMLFNDRFGMHRLYYHESNDAFYFAAEAKAILAVRPELRHVDVRGVAELITCGCTMEDRTLFSRLFVLPSGSSWLFRNRVIDRRTRYFEPREWEHQSTLDPDRCYRELRESIASIVPRYFGGPERVAMSLTGGLDSRIIMAWQRLQPGSLLCYTFAGMIRDSHDVAIARQVANACEQRHEVIRVGDEFLRRFSYYAERTVYLTDGAAGVSRAADLYGNELARDIAPVRMTGNYGGEVLRQVKALKAIVPLSNVFDSELLPYISQATETWKTTMEVNPLSFAVFRQAPWHHYGLLALEESQLSLRSPYMDNDLVRLLFRAPKSSLLNNLMSVRLVADGNAKLTKIETDQGLWRSSPGFLTTVSGWLRKLSFKAEYAYDYGMPQWLAAVDRLLTPLQPESLFLGRHKFTHYRLWYRGWLSPYVQDMLLDRRTLTRPYLHREAVQSLVQNHISGRRNYTSEIHQLLTLELIHRLFIDRQ